MIKGFVGSKSVKRVVEVRVVKLSDKKSKSFSIYVEEGTKEKDYDKEKIKNLLDKLLNEHMQKNGGLKLK